MNTLSSKAILIVDDSPPNLQLLFEYLSDTDYKILIAHSGKKAIKIAKNVHLDLILLDVMMSELDGFTTCDRLKNDSSTKDIPIIFMTALTETINKVQGFKLGAVDYITKPIEKEELLARIKTHLSVQNLNQRLAREVTQQKLLFKISDRIRQSLDLKSILQTATQEIRSFLDCDLVWLACLQENKISIKAISKSNDIEVQIPETITQDYFYQNSAEYQSYLQGNIQIRESIDNLVSSQQLCAVKLQARLIAPILINQTQTANSITTNNTLWGWFIADRCTSCQLWHTEEINLLKRVTTQLALGIKQGLLYKQISQLALIDSLTRVFNRRYFERQLNLEWRRLQRLSAPLSLIMCDIDYFKMYNDSYGHQQGDLCLQKVAQAISFATKRPADIVARYGGEEFAIILPHTPQSGATKVAEDVRVAVKSLNIPHLHSSVDSVVTLSVGVASTVPNSQDNPSLLVKAADLALYKAKEYGRNCISVYPHPISYSKNQQELEGYWIRRIHQALERNLFSLYAQPIESLQDNEQKHFEILLRLTDEDGSVITPNNFLDIADRNSLMPKIDTWVINNLLEKLLATGDLSMWQNHRFSINLSGASLNCESFLQFLTQKLNNYHLPPHLFCFEITETVAVTNLAKVANFIKSLKNIGCSFALDDFGKGMSSLTYLKNLPVDYLKIDGSFIRELNHNKASQVMVEAINHIAGGIGLKTVAEFVENQTILDTVRDLNIDYAQGFYLGRPGVLMEVIIS